MASFVTRPPTMPTTLAAAKLHMPGLLRTDPGSKQLLWFGLMRHQTLGTNNPHQALRHDAIQGRDKTISVDTHMQKTTEYIENIVGMHAGQDEMARQRRLNRNLCRLRIANFTDQDLVRIVAQDRAQAARKIEPL